MKKILRLALFSALLVCGLNMTAQKSTLDVKVDETETYKLIKILDDYHWPYDISNNKKHVAIQGFGATDSYYWSEATGKIPIKGYAFSVSDNGTMSGYYTNNLGISVAGLWSPESQQWEFIGMNPDFPEYIAESPDYSGAWAITDDGKTAAIMQFTSLMSTATYTWSREDGYKKISNGKSLQTRPNAISDDGRVIAGFAAHEDTWEWMPCYWIDGEMKTFPHTFGEALNVSHNGKYVCGRLLDGDAFLYDIEDDKLIEIKNTIQEVYKLSATCVTDNGTVFGFSDGGSPSDRIAFAYVGGELMLFTDYLKLIGIEAAKDWHIYSINNVTEDGKTLIGAGAIDNEECSFILTLENTTCEAPTNLTYTIEDTNDIILKWDAPENAENVTYDIYITYNGAPFANGIKETTFRLDDMYPDDYQFMVRANYNNGECISDISNIVRPKVYPCAEYNKCDLTIVMSDYNSDGWDYGHIQITGTKSDFVYYAKLTDWQDTIAAGTAEEYVAPDTLTLRLCPDKYQFTWMPGNWDAEVSFSIYFNDEEIYHLNYQDIDTTFMKKPMFFEYTIDCEGTESIEETTEKENLSIYPNPVEDKLYIETDCDVENVSIYNITGVLVSQQKTANNSMSIDVKDLNSGIYFVKLTTENGEIVKQFVKK